MNKIVCFIVLLINTIPLVGQAQISDKFYGKYIGETQVDENQSRELMVEIKPTEKGFNVSWTTIKHIISNQDTSKSYSINFIPSDREGIFGSAMKTNLFGGQEALDPMKGEPYFWARENGNSLSVFGMLITADGNYEIQRYDRSLIGDQLIVDYTLIQNEQVLRHIHATLHRQ